MSQITRSASALLEKKMRRPEEYAVYEPEHPVDKVIFADYTRKLQLSVAWVKSLVAGWSRKKAGVLMLSMRDNGEFACMSGMHRVEAARLVGEKTLPAYIYMDLTYEEEADMWLAWSRDKVTTAAQRFNARLEAKDPAALNVRAILLKNGMDVNITSKQNIPNTTRAVAALDLIHRKYGLEALDRLFQFLRTVYGDDMPAYYEPSLKGHAAFLERYAGRIDEKRLVNELRKIGINKLWRRSFALREAGEITSATSLVFAKAILMVYNQGLRNKVEWVERILGKPTRDAMSERERSKHRTPRLEQWVLNALRTSGHPMTILELSGLNGETEQRIGSALKRLAGFERPLVRVVGKAGKKGRLWAFAGH